MLKKLLPLIIILAFGIIMISIGGVNISQANKFPEVSAVVTKVDVDVSYDADGTRTENETVFVEYTVDNQKYDEELNYAPTGLTENDKITVRYNPEKPQYVTGATSKSGVVKIIIGAVVIVAGLGLAVIRRLRGQ